MPHVLNGDTQNVTWIPEVFFVKNFLCLSSLIEQFFLLFFCDMYYFVFLAVLLWCALLWHYYTSFVFNISFEFAIFSTSWNTFCNLMDETSPFCIACEMKWEMLSNLLWVFSLIASCFLCFTENIVKSFRVIADAKETSPPAVGPWHLKVKE